jgi:hypothetical protein
MSRVMAQSHAFYDVCACIESAKVRHTQYIVEL